MNINTIMKGAAVGSLCFLAACGTNESNDSLGEIEIGYNNWAENIAVTNMWKILLEEQGYDVTITPLEKAPIWSAVANDNIDIGMEIWLPITDEPFYDEYHEDIHIGEMWFEGANLGFAVPDYMPITSIDELDTVYDEINGEITGIEAGASISELADQTLEHYGLEVSQTNSSEAAMMTALDTAYQAEEPIVVAMWNPHWAFAEYDIRYLDDPEGTFGEPDDIFFMTRTGFPEDHPDILDWLNTWEMDDENLGELMAMINEQGEEEGASQWIEENRETIDSWIQ